MSRERVSKGQIIMKKEEKLPLVAKVMPENFADKDFIEAFKIMYPKEWANVEKRYAEHLRLNKSGKKIPMPNPEQYLLMAAKKYIDEIRNEHVQGNLLSEDERLSLKDSIMNKSLAKMTKRATGE